VSLFRGSSGAGMTLGFTLVFWVFSVPCMVAGYVFSKALVQKIRLLLNRKKIANKLKPVNFFGSG
ncbi:hypothetical protein, partial [Streptomyces scabiei]|uniref:hypothetical protein n=1 Tax=Streptomyces scabiei TaxID=1930 RepID=UPI0038F6BEFD